MNTQTETPQATGEALRDAGVAAVDAAEMAGHRVWREWAYQALASLAQEGDPFTAEDVRNRVTMMARMGDEPIPEPHHPNAWSALFRTASQRKMIRPTGVWVDPTRAASHAHPLRQWVGR